MERACRNGRTTTSTCEPVVPGNQRVGGGEGAAVCKKKALDQRKSLVAPDVGTRNVYTVTQ